MSTAGAGQGRTVDDQQRTGDAWPLWVGLAGGALCLVGFVSGLLMVDRTTGCGSAGGCQRPDLYLGSAVTALSLALGILLVLVLVVLERLRVLASR